LLFLLLTTSAAWCPAASSSISCYSDSGNPVDWFIVYKLPKRSSLTGLSYMYQDSTTKGWKPGNYLINNTQGAVGRTLTQVYKQRQAQNQETAYVLYNDQSTKHSESNYGHTKGVILLDQKQGFWLVHSTPHFPLPANESYSWPDSGKRNGQSFLCVTYPYAQFNEIGLQLLYNNPHTYSHSVPEPFARDLPDLKKAVEPHRALPPGGKRKAGLRSVAGTNFNSFAKSKAFGKGNPRSFEMVLPTPTSFSFSPLEPQIPPGLSLPDRSQIGASSLRVQTPYLYVDWLAGEFASDLLVQSWPNSRGTLPSNCSGPHWVYNVDTIHLPGNPDFTSTVDHSKWCVTHPRGDGPSWVCVGDINRDRAEEFRGGGVVCVNDPAVWKSFSSLVLKFKDCSSRN
ncbi:deoxyribonuclease-2-alpha-like, partial [Callorhinchus milii]|uniref:deoxyribonuclease-2-alpha-like n=1 Tax=Callorhinchus milii TaxID=7868 RepID=UPI001C3F9D66